MVRAIYDSIYKDLLDRIEEGEYGYQSYIPSEGTLVKQYGCSHNTLRKAIALLAQRGYLQPVHGKGVRVIWQPKERTAFEMGGSRPSRRPQLATDSTPSRVWRPLRA